MGNVMSGIAEALVATGVGLFVALPAVVAYNVVQKRIGEIESRRRLASASWSPPSLKAQSAPRRRRPTTRRRRVERSSRGSNGARPLAEAEE